MKKVSVLFAASLAMLTLVSCGGGSTEPANADTVVVKTTDTIVETVAAPIDSAAVVAYYEAAHKKAVSKHTPAPKAHHIKKEKKVSADSYEPVEHHDVMTIEQPAPAPADAAPAKTKVVVVHDVQTVYFRPDEKASFPGGEKAFDEYIMKNLEYPEEALNSEVQGTVHAVVTLDPDGNVKKVEFPDGRLGYGLNREAERVLMASPRWNPAKHAGTPVASKFGIPITYKIH